VHGCPSHHTGILLKKELQEDFPMAFIGNESAKLSKIGNVSIVLFSGFG
jgi:hypothetical protein